MYYYVSICLLSMVFFFYIQYSIISYRYHSVANISLHHYTNYFILQGSTFTAAMTFSAVKRLVQSSNRSFDGSCYFFHTFWTRHATTKVRQLTSLDEDVLEEKFIKGSGPGGQKINTRANRVVLRHIPTGLEVSCQDHRDLTSNRRLARKWLTR